MIFQLRIRNETEPPRLPRGQVISQAPISELRKADFALYGYIAGKSPADAMAFTFLKNMIAPGGLDSEMTSPNARMLFFLWADFVKFRQGKTGQPERLVLEWFFESEERIGKAAAAFQNSNIPKFLEPQVDFTSLKKAGYNIAKLEAMFKDYEKAAPSRLWAAGKQIHGTLESILPFRAADNFLHAAVGSGRMNQEIGVEFIAAVSVFFAPELKAIRPLILLAVSKAPARVYLRKLSRSVSNRLAARSQIKNLTATRLRAEISLVFKSAVAKADKAGMQIISDEPRRILTDDFLRLLDQEITVHASKYLQIDYMASVASAPAFRTQYRELMKNGTERYPMRTLLNSMVKNDGEIAHLKGIYEAHKTGGIRRATVIEKLEHYINAGDRRIIGIPEAKGSHMKVIFRLPGNGRKSHSIILDKTKLIPENYQDLITALYAANFTPKEILRILN